MPPTTIAGRPRPSISAEDGGGGFQPAADRPADGRVDHLEQVMRRAGGLFRRRAGGQHAQSRRTICIESALTISPPIRSAKSRA
ncbi:hypothetical protein ACRAWD_03740 [Caulobacter segnis]